MRVGGFAQVQMIKAAVVFIIVESLTVLHAARLKPLEGSLRSKPESSSVNADAISKNRDYQKLIQNSETFLGKNPLPATAKTFKNRLLDFPDSAEKLVDFAKNTRIIIHQKLRGLLRQSESVLNLWSGESLHKKLQKSMDRYKSFSDTFEGSKPRSLYNLVKGAPQLNDPKEEKKLNEYLHHLFKHRPLALIAPGDNIRLRDSEKLEIIRIPPGYWSEGKYEGKTYLKYSEMEISALLGMSGPTLFLSDCDRDNPREDERVEEGVIIGIVGARFEKRDRMESRYILFPLVDGYANDVDKLIAKLFDSERILNNREFHDQTVRVLNKQKDPDFVNGISTKEVKGFVFRQVQQKRFAELVYFNETIYRRRMRLIAEMVLGEANDRAASKQKEAYVVVVNLDSSDDRKLFDGQERLYLEELIDALERSNFENVSDLDLRHFENECNEGKAMRGNTKITAVTNQAEKQITVHCSNDPPAKLRKNEMEGKLVVLAYPRDSNSFPGNEYWVGAFNSADPAAARCSLITELHNPYVNRFLDPKNPESVHVVV